MFRYQTNEKGLTLLELVMSISIVMLSLNMSFNGMQWWLNHSRITSTVNNYSHAFQLAKLYAIQGDQTISLCLFSDQQHCGIKDSRTQAVVFIDKNINRVFDEDDTLLYSLTNFHTNIKVRSSRALILFHAGGITASPTSLYVCTVDTHTKLTRGYTLNLQARIRFFKDKDRDGIVEDRKGKPITC